MKHDYTTEVWGIYGMRGSFSPDYLEKHDIEKAGRDEWKPEGKAYRKMCRVGGGSFKWTTASGTREMYMFGEKTFFDTVEEVQEAKAEYQARRTLNARRTAVMKKFEGLSVEELEELAERLGL